MRYYPSREAHSLQVLICILSKGSRSKKGRLNSYQPVWCWLFPPGWEGQVRCRSGLGKKGLILPNGVGTIDADYRGELMVLAHWIGEGDSFVVEKGERIGQILLKRVPEIRFVEVEREALDETEWGEGGFGSTGRF